MAPHLVSDLSPTLIGVSYSGAFRAARRARIRATEQTMATKKYLCKKLDGTEDWVTDPKDATADYRKPAEVTQVSLAIMGVRGTTLVEVPDAHQMESKYIICRAQ
jgi:hypothetical protein